MFPDIATGPSPYDAVVTAIQGQGAWARIDPTVWLVSTMTASAAQVRDKIGTAMHQGDLLFVGRLTKEWGAFNFAPEIVTWLEKVKF